MAAPLATPLPMTSGPRTELPDNPASLPEGLVAPPDFADTIFGDDGEEDPAWVALRDQINDAMTTWSEEGLAVLQPLLSHPSARVRAETVDAIIQMDLPAASPILRAAARRASSPAERRRLEQAAAFNDLPALSPQEVRQLLSPNASGGKPRP
ncbi:MAG: HEAT repeat domain-containing protein [Chthoniobacterales bacterium]